MNPTENSRHLHFYVRSPDYDHVHGYGYFLDAARRGLNAEPPQSAEALLTRLAELLYARNPAERTEKLIRSLPDEIRPAQEHYAELRADALFGPAADKKFGLLMPESEAQNKREQDAGQRPLSGYSLITPISSGSMAGYDSGAFRAYEQTMRKNTGLHWDLIPSDFHRAFTYTIPGTDETLALMQIGSRKTLLPEYKSRLHGTPEAIEGMAGIQLQQKYQLIFLHPFVDQPFFDTLTRAVNPLLAAIDNPALPANEKDGKIAELYWLAAQSTPVVRGGSAYANILLEHATHRAGLPERPYTQQGVDLWAEAATSSLADFKARFLNGQFFDKSATDKSVREYLSHFHSLEQGESNLRQLRDRSRGVAL